MDFSLSPELKDLQHRTRTFIRDRIIPLEADPRQTHHGPTEEFRRELVGLAAEQGLVAPHVGTEYGGLGLSHCTSSPPMKATCTCWNRSPRMNRKNGGCGRWRPAPHGPASA
jgi:alkylation response protein AidB-like acyl-CoA dehydrogenase